MAGGGGWGNLPLGFITGGALGRAKGRALGRARNGCTDAHLHSGSFLTLWVCYSSVPIMIYKCIMPWYLGLLKELRSVQFLANQEVSLLFCYVSSTIERKKKTN